ncbi:MAG: hypothetical protein V4547_20205 [Bacteroidota bacterium]
MEFFLKDVVNMFVDLSSQMSGKSIYIKVNEQNNLLLKAVLKYCLFVLFGFLFVWGQSSASASTQGKKIAIHQDLTCHLSDDLFNSSHHPFHLPFESAPTPNEPEASDENGQEDNFDDDLIPLIWNDPSEGTFNISASVRNDFFKIVQSFQNRSTVPLFILYHSWKIYQD